MGDCLVLAEGAFARTRLYFPKMRRRFDEHLDGYGAMAMIRHAQVYNVGDCYMWAQTAFVAHLF
jgi:hypothetical protein